MAASHPTSAARRAWAGRPRRARLILPSALAVLLAALVVLQMRWLDELAAARLEEQQRSVQIGVDRLAADLDAALARLVDAMSEGGDGRLDPETAQLVAEVVEVTRGAAGGVALSIETAGGLRTGLGAEGREAWDEAQRDRLAGLLDALWSSGPRAWTAAQVLPGPAVLLPRADGSARCLLLDRQAFAERLIPRLVCEVFGEAGAAQYLVSVVPADASWPPLYETPTDIESPTADESPRSIDAAAPTLQLRNQWRPLFLADGLGEGPGHAGAPGWTLVGEGVLSEEQLREALAAAGTRGWNAAAKSGGTGSATDTATAAHPATNTTPPAAYLVQVQHRAGSLVAALAQARRRELWLGGAVLALLVVGMVMVVLSEARSRRLAEKELAFVAGVSHELRTPLSVMRLAASNLRSGVVAEAGQVAEYGELVEREVLRMSGLVERVLRFADGGSTDSRREPVDVAGLIEGAVTRCEPWRDRRTFDVEWSVEQGLPTVQGDVDALSSAVQNLVDNAIKFGPDGQTVRVRAERLTNNGRDQVRIEVLDEGPGIPRSERRRVRLPFERGEAARDASLPGSGLGLSVVQQVADEHGGRLDIAEAAGAGGGAVVALELPLGPDAEHGR